MRFLSDCDARCHYMSFFNFIFFISFDTTFKWIYRLWAIRWHYLLCTLLRYGWIHIFCSPSLVNVYACVHSMESDTVNAAPYRYGYTCFFPLFVGMKWNSNVSFLHKWETNTIYVYNTNTKQTANDGDDDSIDVFHTEIILFHSYMSHIVQCAYCIYTMYIFYV